MADDLKLAVVIEALLNAKGFEDAQNGIKGLTTAANAAKAPLKGAGDEGKKLGESFGGTRGPVADLTRVMLMNVGVTGAAGEAAKAAGTAMYFLEGAATASAAAISAGVAIVAFGLPLLIKWATTTNEQKKEQAELKEEIDKTLPIIERYAASAKTLTESARLQLAVNRPKMLREEHDEMVALSHEVLFQTELQKSLAAQHKIVHAEEIAELGKQRGRLMDLTEAQAKGITTVELYERRIQGEADAHAAAAEAAKQHAAAVDDVSRFMAINSQAQLDAIEIQRDLAESQEKDAEKVFKDEGRRQRAEYEKKLKAEAEYQDDLRVQKERQIAVNRAVAESERINALNAVGYAGQALGALSALFGRNKALAIAGAIADTYAAANLALRTIPPPAGYVAAAASIAIGIANVQAIRKAEPTGFDDPFSDLVAAKLGRRSAQDFAKYFAGQFMGEMPAAMVSQYHSRTTIDRSTNYDFRGQTINGVIGGKMAVARAQERQLRRAERVRRRTTLGR